MQTTILLLRGINVGATRSLPMAVLRALLTELGAEEVRTYIQSGNAVFRHAELETVATRLGEAIEAKVGFRPQVLVLSLHELEQAVAANPFPEAVDVPKSLHLFFLESTPPAPDLAGMAQLAKASERFQLLDRVFYLHAPEGIGKSKLAAGVEKRLGVPATARNWRTVTHLLELGREVDMAPCPEQ